MKVKLTNWHELQDHTLFSVCEIFTWILGVKIKNLGTKIRQRYFKIYRETHTIPFMNTDAKSLTYYKQIKYSNSIKG